MTIALQHYIFMAKGLQNLTSNTFYMKGSPETKRIKQAVIVSFEPDANGFVKPQMRALLPSPIPTFLKDNKVHTPGFHLKGEPLDEQQLLNDYQSKLNRVKPIEVENIMEPKPGSKADCKICHMEYFDYREHIRSLTHRKQLFYHPAQKRIRKLCRSYKEIKSINSSTSQQESEFEFSESEHNSQSSLINTKPQTLHLEEKV